jgi:glycosyltransferase involved in cell wall biosynthesis
MTRVLHVNHTSVVGGAERSLLALLDHTDRSRIAGVCCPPGPLADEVLARDLQWHATVEPEARFDASGADRLGAAWRMARGGWTIETAARATGADVVHANSIRTALTATLSTQRVVTHVRDVLPPGFAARSVKRIVAARSTRVVGISRFVAARFAGDVARAGRWSVVDNPIDLRSFPVRDAKDRPRARRRLGFDADVPLALVVGQITPWKRQLLAIEAAADLRARGVDVHLAIVGSVKFTRGRTGAANAEYERRLRLRTEELGLRDVVTFSGECPNVGDLLAGADAMIVPSLDEPFGRVAAEAISSGVPVLTARIGGPADVVSRCGGGLTVDGENPRAWAAGLESLLASSGYGGSAVAYEAIRRVRATFDAALHGRTMGRIFDEVAAGVGPSGTA